MTADPSLPIRRLAIHTITTKPWDLSTAIAEYGKRGVTGVSVWVEALQSMSARQARRLLDDYGMSVPALVRGGFFVHPEATERTVRIDRNRAWIETAATLGAEMLVLVVGAHPGVPLDRQRGWVRDAIEAILPHAEAAGVRLAIEPLHPMYAADRSCINRMSEARQICERLNHPLLGIAVDVYHVWWDPDLAAEIRQAGAQHRLFALHVCDWRVPTRDLLTDRALMGDGCIDIRGIRHQVEATGYSGWIEVEIFSEELWRGNQGQLVDEIVDRYLGFC